MLISKAPGSALYEPSWTAFLRSFMADLDPQYPPIGAAQTTMMRALRLAPILLLVLASLGCHREPRWNVLLVTFDTTRADHIGCYGHERAATPNLDALAAEGFRFEHAFTAVPVTLPSHSTILTGQYPLAHGVRDNGIFRLSDSQETLAEILAAVGYRAAAAVGAFPLAARFGANQGFELYDGRFANAFQDFLGQRAVAKTGLYFDERRASLVNDALLPWLDEHHEERFFAWAHYFDPHQPYSPPPPYDDLFVDSPYDGEIAYADEAFGDLLDHLREWGVLDRTLIIFTSDHGEGLGEHNELTHSTLAYNSTLHVPLILRIPGQVGGVVVPQRVGTVDIAPTVLDFLGVQAPVEFQGQSLRPLIESRGAPVASFPRPQYAETLAPRFAHDLGELRVLFARQFKYIHGPRPELYDLAADPREHENLISQRPELADGFEAKLSEFLARHGRSDPEAVTEMDPETRRRLESLGYIQSRAGGLPTLSEELRSDGTPPQDQVDDINELSSAKQLLFKQHPLAAKRVIEVLLDRHPDNAIYLQLRARAELGLGQLEEALATLERVSELNPQALPGEPELIQVATFLFRKGEASRALAMVEAHQEVTPSPVGQWLQASLYSAVGQPDREKESLQQALELNPSFAPARVDLAVHRARAGDFDGATDFFQRALSDMPYYAKGHYNFAAMLLEKGSPQEALERFERAVEIEPLYLQARYAVVATALGLGQSERAESAMGDLQAVSPAGPETAAAAALLEGDS